MRLTRRLSTAITCVCLCVCFLISQTHARIDEFDQFITDRELFALDTSFGLQVGGTINISLHVEHDALATTPRAHNLYLVILNEEQSRPLFRRFESRDCDLSSTARFEFLEDIEINFIAKSTDLYYVAITNCHQFHTITLTGTVTWTNPGGSGMSMSVRNVRRAYTFIGAFSCLLLLLWLVSVLGRGTLLKNAYPYQRLLTAALLFATLQAVFLAMWGGAYERTGLESLSLIRVHRAARVLCDLCAIVLILPMSIGLFIIRTRLTKREVQVSLGVTVAYMIVDALYVSCEQPMNLCAAYMITLFVVKFLIAFSLLVVISANFETMRSKLMSEENPSRRRDIVIKKEAFGRLLILFITYLCTPIALLFVRVVVLSWESEWLAEALQFVIELCCLAGVCFSVRPSIRHRLFARAHDYDNETYVFDDDNDIHDDIASLDVDLEANSQEHSHRERDSEGESDTTTVSLLAAARERRESGSESESESVSERDDLLSHVSPFESELDREVEREQQQQQQQQQRVRRRVGVEGSSNDASESVSESERNDGGDRTATTATTTIVEDAAALSERQARELEERNQRHERRRRERRERQRRARTDIERQTRTRVGIELESFVSRLRTMFLDRALAETLGGGVDASGRSGRSSRSNLSPLDATYSTDFESDGEIGAGEEGLEMDEL